MVSAISQTAFGWCQPANSDRRQAANSGPLVTKDTIPESGHSLRGPRWADALRDER